MTKEELLQDRPCQVIEGKKIPCNVILSHLEALEEIERLRKEYDPFTTERNDDDTTRNSQMA